MNTQSINLPITSRSESIDSSLARNLVIGRAIRGLTQQELARRSHISRATIAQLETGYSDPRVSTIVELAQGIGIAPMLLWISQEEIRALSALPIRMTGKTIHVTSHDAARMEDLLATGLLKDRLRAASFGAALARHSGASDNSSISAAIFAAVAPRAGLNVGKLLGDLLKSKP